MPYIKQEIRNKLDPYIHSLASVIVAPGELAYVVDRLVLPVGTYAAYSAARAVLKDVYDVITEEFLSYERKKRGENGDIL